MAVIPLVSSPPASYLFDRTRSAHPWLAALNALSASTVAGHAALAQNWRMDARVDTGREKQLEGSGCFPLGSSGNGFDAAMSEYHVHYLCRSPAVPPRAAYVESANDGNLIPFDKRPARNHRLLHMASVKNLLKFAMSPAASGKVDFEMAVFRLAKIRLTSKPSTSDVEKLVNALQTLGLDAIKEFAGELSDALGDTEPHWWAAFSHEIGDLDNTSDWTDVVRKAGQGHIEQGEWLLAWRYSPELAGKLYRPTVAEAGAYAFHYPSLPQENYGITMPLAQGLPAVRELIHAPLKGDVSADACIGFGKVFGIPVPVRTSHVTAAWFHTRRHEHALELARHQPPHTQSWLTRHAILS